MAHILIIDDDEFVRISVEAVLQDRGHTFEEAVNGRIGLDKAKANLPDLVITDIIMPEMEGIEAIQHLRKLSPRLPIIAISGGGRIGTMDFLTAAKSLGATATLRKPFEDQELIDMIDSALDKAGGTDAPGAPARRA